MSVTGSESSATHSAESRRTVRLSHDSVPAVPEQQVPSRRPQPRRPLGDRLLLLAERAVGDWAPTLRLALLLAFGALGGLALIVALAGVLPAVLGALVLIALGISRTR